MSNGLYIEVVWIVYWGDLETLWWGAEVIEFAWI